MRSLLSIFSSRNRNPLAAIGIFAALVVAIEGGLALLPQSSFVKALRARGEPPALRPDIQIMGDSVAQSGILCAQLTSQLPSHPAVYNYALAGTGPEFPYFLLKRQIAAGRAPKEIVYAPSPHTFTTTRVPLLLAAFCDWREVPEVLGSGIETAEVVYGILCKMSYTLRHREEIAERLKGKVPHVRKAPPAYDKSVLPEVLYPMIKKRFTVHPFNDFYIEKFLKLAAGQGITVHWFSMPVLEVVSESRKVYDFDADYYRYVDQVRERFGIHLLQRELPVLAGEDFRDFFHLSGDAAERLTAELARKFLTGEAEAGASSSMAEQPVAGP